MDSTYPLDLEAYMGKQVLVAEDNLANQLVLKMLLKKVGIIPVFANNGQEMIDLYKANPKKWHLLLMDCEMPLVDGYQATKTIREYEQSEAVTPTSIVGLSAHALPEHKKKALDHGMNDYLTKPLNRDLLFEAMKQYFNTHIE